MSGQQSPQALLVKACAPMNVYGVHFDTELQIDAFRRLPSAFGTRSLLEGFSRPHPYSSGDYYVGTFEHNLAASKRLMAKLKKHGLIDNRKGYFERTPFGMEASS